MAIVIVKHLIILININNMYKLEKAFKVLLEELLQIVNVIIPKKKLNISTITL